MRCKYKTPWGYSMWDIVLADEDVKRLEKGRLPLYVQPEYPVARAFALDTTRQIMLIEEIEKIEEMD